MRYAMWAAIVSVHAVSRWCPAAFSLLLTITLLQQAAGEDAQWIWSPAYDKELAPAGDCYFRKSFNIDSPEEGQIEIGCDDRYELFVNGRLVGSGENWKVLDVYDVAKYLISGPNTIAVKGANAEQGSAGLVARVVVKQRGGTHVTHSTDGTWKTSLKEFTGWQKPRYEDTQWLAARSFGVVGATLPWGNEVTVAGSAGRFKIAPDFKVEKIIDGKLTGSLIGMIFDEFGQIVAAREDGPLILIRDENKDGELDAVSTLCDEVKHCQGLLSVSGRVFAVGQGPQGAAIYRLKDEDQDGKTDRVDAILKFAGEMGEHGPHSLVLGPDGLIYMVVGNFSRADRAYEPGSPYHHAYEGDLVTPRYEDAGGHAVGVKAPGGTILRTDTNGSAVEIFAGGLQNPFDIAFNQAGDLFTADSDMEWDSGMPWYRPTRVNHVLSGAEFGWRSGWAKWPDYFADSLPPMIETGRGSPTGMEVYNHVMFPKRYHDALFVCDWSRGRILAVRMKSHGASYKGSAETFLEGQPLNVTDIAVGPDGGLYFCTGGRDTEGGVYRITWQGKVPAEVSQRGKGLAGALRQPQLNSAWARQQLALIKQQMGAKWGPELAAVAEDSQKPIEQRLRALDLLELFGPKPTGPMLVKVSHDEQPALRAKAVWLMGIHTTKTTYPRILEMLTDTDKSVQRAVCEAVVRSGQSAPAEKLMALLGSPDRHVSWSARRALQKMPKSKWEKGVLDAPTKVFLSGSLALLALDPETSSIDKIIERSSRLLEGYLSDDEFLQLMRVVQLALVKGELTGANVAHLRRQLAGEYPSQDARMNRELVRLLTYLQEPSAAGAFIQQLKGDAPNVEKMQVAMHARFLEAGWTPPLKLDLLKFYEEARGMPGGHSFAGYIENVSRDFFAGLNDAERQLVLADGAKWPTSALSVLAKLPEEPSAETLKQIQLLDKQVKKVDSEAARRLRIGISAVLGGSRDPQALAYLRELFESEPDRRVPIAMSLAQQPDGENWPLLVRSLPVVEGAAAQEVLTKLTSVRRKPDKPEPYRQVILRGLLLRENGGQHAVSLLEAWTGNRLSQPDDSWEVALAAWQQWFVETYPDEPAPKLPVEPEDSHWTYQELLSQLTGAQASHGDRGRGAAVFEKAQCAKCHRYGARGDSVGPDLTTISQRFQRKEILESILFPSQVISDQYATQTVVTKDGRSITGMVAPAGDGSLIVLQSDGKQATIAKDDIEQTTRTKKSSMPEGLLNALSLEEIADLFAYLTKPAPAELTRRPRGKTN